MAAAGFEIQVGGESADPAMLLPAGDDDQPVDLGSEVPLGRHQLPDVLGDLGRGGDGRTMGRLGAGEGGSSCAAAWFFALRATPLVSLLSCCTAEHRLGRLALPQPHFSDGQISRPAQCIGESRPTT